jgi:hypothetical protein
MIALFNYESCFTKVFEILCFNSFNRMLFKERNNLIINIVTLKSTVFSLWRLIIFPQFKYFIKLLINCSSRKCWVSVKLKHTWKPRFSLYFFISTKKQLSPVANPANHWGSGIFEFITTGLGIGVISEKATFSERPKFIDAFIATNSFKPSLVKCLSALILSYPCLNSSKSALFLCNWRVFVEMVYYYS